MINALRFIIALGIFILIATIISLFMIKAKVQKLHKELLLTDKVILEEKENIHLLHAEIAYLTRPQAIAELAKRHLNLQIITPSQVIDISNNKH